MTLPPEASPVDASVAPAIVETHVSVILFIGDRAYKLKKPVRFGFLDFSTREARQSACHREVALNRRLAPDVYLGVADVLGPDGEVCDHLVVMRRMDAARCLTTLVVEGDPGVRDHLRAIARSMAAFHERAERGPAIDAACTAEARLGAWRDNHTEMRRLPGPLLDPEGLDTAVAAAGRFLAGREALLAERAEQGRCCDGHGDLQAADVFCLDDGPRILDCIEFDDRLRYGDVIDDVAFLAMDLERLGAPRQAAHFLSCYEEFAGEALPPSLLHAAIAYRAHIRAKVAALRWAQAPPDSTQARLHGDEAQRLLTLCLDHLQRAKVRLVLVGGLPGTGKTTTARRMARRDHLVHLRSDVLRKELAGIAPTARAGSAFGAGIYDDAMTHHVYDELLRRGRRLLERGESVVLDASWSDGGRRAAARALAEATHSDLVEVRCEVDAGTAASRIAARSAANADASDATPAIAQSMAAHMDPWPEATVVDTGGPA